MSVRNFTRVFRDETGTTPADFVEVTQVDATSDCSRRAKPITARGVALWQEPDTLRRVFLAIETGPSDYRWERFRR
jgi:transcriptional regulator GlxA family with amidase domain